MRNLSLREFKNICDTLSLNKFIFSSENQCWNKVEHTLRAKLTFTIMLIAFNPNAICFKNPTNDCICLDRVKSIQMSEGISMLGTIFTVICGDSSNNYNDMAYTIIAR